MHFDGSDKNHSISKYNSNPQLSEHQMHPDQHIHQLEDMEKYLEMDHMDLNLDWEFAKQHGKATLPGINETGTKIQCICCMREIRQSPIPLSQNSKELQFLGAGFPLFFIFTKYTIILLLLLILGYSSIAIFWALNYNFDFCQNHIDRLEVKCTSYMVQLSSVQIDVTDSQLVLRISSFFLQLLMLIYMRDTIRKTEEYYDERAISYSDYAVMIENLPTKENIKDDENLKNKNIKQILQGFLNDNQIFFQTEDQSSSKTIQLEGKPIEVVKVVYISMMEHFQKLKKRKEEVVHELKSLLNSKKDHSKIEERKKKKKQLKFEMHKLNKELLEEKNRLKNQINLGEADCDKVIAIAKNESQRDDMEQCFNRITKSQLQKHFGKYGSNVKLSRAPEPTEIIWEHINISKSQRRHRLLVSFVLFVIILGALTTGFYFLLHFKSSQVIKATTGGHAASDESSSFHADYVKARAIVYCSLVLIIFFNKFVLAYFVHHLVQFEKPPTGENLQASICLKYTFGLFFTTALMTLLVQGATDNNVYKEDYGVVEQQTIMFYFSALLVPLIWLINPWYIVNWLIQRLNFKKNYKLTQEEANKIMQYPEYLMGKRYGELLQSVWFTFLYASIIPIGSIFTLVGISIYYWVDKYNLLRKSSILAGVSPKITIVALKLLEFTLVLRPLGELVFDHLVRDEWHPLSVVTVSIGCVYMILPINKFLNRFHKERFLGHSKEYKDMIIDNVVSYQMMNPLYRQEQLKKHFHDIEECSDADHHHAANYKHKIGRSTSKITSNKHIHHHHHHKNIHRHKRSRIVRPHGQKKKASRNNITSHHDISSFNSQRLEAQKKYKEAQSNQK